MESSLNALIFEVLGTCGPRQKSMKCGPSVYSVKTSPARSAISSHFIQASEYLRKPSSLLRVDALVGEIARLNLPHFLFDFFQIFGRERRGAVEIVIEAGVDGRPDAELGFGIELEHGRGQQVRGGMAIDLQRFADLYW